MPRKTPASPEELADLVRAVFGDDPKWVHEATRIEELVAAGNIEDADIALAKLAFNRLGGTRQGIDVAIARAAMAMATFHAKHDQREDLERVADMFGNTFGPWDKRALPIIDALKKLAR